MPRKEIFLATQIRDPEAVNHIMRRELDHHRLADGNVNLVGGVDDVVWNWIFVRNFPPPLMPGDVDCQQWSVRHPANVARNREVIEKEKEQKTHRREEKAHKREEKAHKKEEKMQKEKREKKGKDKVCKEAGKERI